MGGGELDSETSTPGGAEASWIDCGVRKKLGLDLWCGEFPAADAARRHRESVFLFVSFHVSLFSLFFERWFESFISLGWMRLLVLKK
jgi:hypothetical protein